ncbi:MAG: hypothetical protein KF708_19975 [Pirellulales bacterium]|nr:hypothetical protein [Pirellulales bacterium]
MESVSINKMNELKPQQRYDDIRRLCSKVGFLLTPLRSLSKWTLLLAGTNAILVFTLVALVAFNPNLLSPPDEAVAQASENGAKLGMDLCGARGSLSVFVDKGFPGNPGIKIFDTSQQLYILREVVPKETVNEMLEGSPGDTVMRASISLGVDFDMECYYSIDRNKRLIIHELKITNKDVSMIDLNADLMHDLRIDMRRRLVQVWHEREWRDVSDGRSQYERKLLDGTHVKFDSQGGQWRSSTDEESY